MEWLLQHPAANTANKFSFLTAAHASRCTNLFYREPLLSTMPRIRQLDEDTIAKIAAGEVIERPSSVVKELVENAIDAGATIITVSVEEGGKRLIAVTDNGCGMSPEDARLAFEKHATSKITIIEDLDRLESLGFRGEALPSIAKISSVTLITSARETGEGRSEAVETDRADAVHGASGAAGTEIRIDGGEVLHVRETGAPGGTTVIVENLFFNLPVRRKYMKSPRAEFKHISSLMVRFSLGHPGISFSLKHNKRRVFSTPRTGNVRNTISEVLGREIAGDMIWIEAGNRVARLHGYIAKPVHRRPDRGRVFINVNGRPVNSPELVDALRAAYGNLIPRGKFPVAVLHIDISPSMVDVNIHPSKEKIQFVRDYEIIDMLFDAVKEVLAKENLIPGVSAKRASKQEVLESEPGSTDSSASTDRLRESAAPYGGVAESRDMESSEEKGVPDVGGAAPLPVSAGVGPGAGRQTMLGVSGCETIESPDTAMESTGRLPSMRPLGQVLDLYIIAGGRDGLYIIDQHAAHEKALFERFLERAEEEEEKGAAHRQPLITPVTFSVPPAGAEEFEKLLPVLESLGFQVEPFGRNSYVVKAIPVPMTASFGRGFMDSMIADLLSGKRPTSREEIREKMAALMACHTAVRAGKSLTIPEIRTLLAEIAESENPFACPHGRPTIVHLSSDELERMFKRK